jgi:MOSC domain-containing protein YiiM
MERLLVATQTSPPTSLPVGPHLTVEELEAGLAHVRLAPREAGRVALIIARPSVDLREELEVGRFTANDGLVGDRWRRDAAAHAPEDEVPTDGQVTFINARYLDLIARGARHRWALAGDQLVVDLDLGQDNLAPGDRLAIGTTLFEVTTRPHLGCRKFSDRFGVDALRFANSQQGRQQRLRGMYARVVQDGHVRVGDTITPARIGPR